MNILKRLNESFDHDLVNFLTNKWAEISERLINSSSVLKLISTIDTSDVTSTFMMPILKQIGHFFKNNARHFLKKSANLGAPLSPRKKRRQKREKKMGKCLSGRLPMKVYPKVGQSSATSFLSHISAYDCSDVISFMRHFSQSERGNSKIHPEAGFCLTFFRLIRWINMILIHFY